jgi:hypothetical protein
VIRQAASRQSGLGVIATATPIRWNNETCDTNVNLIFHDIPGFGSFREDFDHITDDLLYTNLLDNLHHFTSGSAILILTFWVVIKGFDAALASPRLPGRSRQSQSHWRGPGLLAAAMHHGGRGVPGVRGESVLTRRRRLSFNMLVLKFSSNSTAARLRRR